MKTIEEAASETTKYVLLVTLGGSIVVGSIIMYF